MNITVTVNGQTYTHDVEPRLLLALLARQTGVDRHARWVRPACVEPVLSI